MYIKFRADNIEDLACCGCVIRVTHGLPCVHEISEYNRSNKPIPIDVIYTHWRQLGVGQTMYTSDDQEKFPVKTYISIREVGTLSNMMMKEDENFL